MLLRAFSSGAVALSGVEAVSNGVPAFKRPESHNAARTLVVDGHHPRHDLPRHLDPRRQAQALPGRAGPDRHLAHGRSWIYGGKGVLYWMTQIGTFAILILAANTAYADFPRLSSIISRDGFLPRQFSNRGDRLVFSNGIIFLALMAGVLIIVFKGNISKLIPLYAFGVFTGFTLSQAGMVVHHLRLKEPRWRLSALHQRSRRVTTGDRRPRRGGLEVHGGSLDPGCAHPDHGRSASAVIGRHYHPRPRGGARPDPGYRPPRHTHYVVVLVGSVNKGAHATPSATPAPWPRTGSSPSRWSVTRASRRGHEGLGRTPHPDRAAHHLVALPRATRPILNYLDELDAESSDDIITVVIPEFVTDWSSQFLHNQSALALKARLLYRPNTVVTSVPVVVD